MNAITFVRIQVSLALFNLFNQLWIIILISYFFPTQQTLPFCPTTSPPTTGQPSSIPKNSWVRIWRWSTKVRHGRSPSQVNFELVQTTFLELIWFRCKKSVLNHNLPLLHHVFTLRNRFRIQKNSSVISWMCDVEDIACADPEDIIRINGYLNYYLITVNLNQSESELVQKRFNKTYLLN